MQNSIAVPLYIKVSTNKIRIWTLMNNHEACLVNTRQQSPIENENEKLASATSLGGWVVKGKNEVSGVEAQRSFLVKEDCTETPPLHLFFTLQL